MEKKINLLLFFICVLSITTRSQTIKAVVADQETGESIPYAFVFWANSSTGTSTDDSGAFQLDLKENDQNTLVFSHLNYELLTIELTAQKRLPDTFFLVPSGVVLGEIKVVGKSRSRIRARWLKKFKTAFLGTSTEQKSVKILNPEVLIFKEEEYMLFAEASAPLEIENKQIGYNLDFYLEKFQLDQSTDDLLYKGNAYFKVLEGNTKELEKYEKNRKQIYQKISRRFFAELIQKKAKEEDYAVGFSALNYQQREFTNYQPTVFDSIKIRKLEHGKYVIEIRGFFTITCKNEKFSEENPKPPPTLGFSPRVKVVKKEENRLATSYLRSKTNQIIVNKYGRILNALDVEEYGYWAEQRVAFLLPFDYQ